MEKKKEKNSNDKESRQKSILDVMYLSDGLVNVEVLEKFGIYIKKPLKADTSKLYPKGGRVALNVYK